ncbi:hypothetical protein F1C58_13980 [Glaciihabitans sp. INWT7]|uniref:hypothetical protein n=1 Tax=Glaciihabitans sp. INWT7 TaxID=2596912 RepID=UPI0016283C67|nr:hypothetical protein [Glaciihabitans sp. INWT7]QNE47895.1 hypothetical protein F1C58_13980 [Glaciihabitans sp. INWT7]
MDYDALGRNGLILFTQLRDVLGDSRALRRDAERGILVKLRRGAFVTRTVWDAADTRERHLLRARAALAAVQRPAALAGVSAAAVWGMPIDEAWPTEVTILDEWRGGGRSEPGVRKTASGFRTASIQVVDGIPVTSIERTAIDVARTHSFTKAIGSLDWVLWRKRSGALEKAALVEELDRLHPRFGIRHLQRCIGFSTSLSDSFGESTARSVIHLLGFDAPELQVEFVDAQGRIEPDFFWRSVRRAAEFDGKSKYTRDEFTRGDPGDVVWREKKREDRLRALEVGVTRILTEHVEAPVRLERMLLQAGVPRGGAMTSWRDV